MRDLLRSLANTSRRESPSQPKCIRFNAFGTKPTGRCVAGRLADDLPAVWAVALQRRHVAGIEARLEHAERRQAEIAGWELYGARLLRVARQEARGLQIEGIHERLGQSVASRAIGRLLRCLLPFPGDFVEPPLDFVLRQPAATHHYPGLPVDVADILERVPLHQD